MRPKWVVCAAVLSLLLAPPTARAGSVASARARISMAKESLDREDYDRVESSLDSAEKALDGLSDAEKAPVLAEIKAVRDQIQTAQNAGKIKTMEKELDRHLRQAESDLESGARSPESVLKVASDRLKSDDAKVLPPETVKKYQDRINQIRVKMGGANKKDALDRAADPLKELEEKVASDPFKGLDQPEAYRASSDLKALRTRVTAQLEGLSKDDADVKAMLDRVAAVDKKIAGYDAAWGRAQAGARVASSWKDTKDRFEGWEQESPDAAKGMGEWSLPKTALAIRLLGWWLDDKSLKELRNENKDDATIQSTFAEAEKTLAAAADKLNAAFGKMMDDAEKLPTPNNRFDLERASTLASNVESEFAGTRYKDANVARAKKLDQKWKDDVEAKRKAGEALYNKLSAEANAAWPKIESSLKPQSGFNPNDASWRGKTIVLKGVYNRARWDFIDADFAMRVNGTPVAGFYEPKIGAALSDAVHRTNMSVDDHAPWDVVAVVEGPGQLRERTSISVKNQGGLEIGKLEEWRPVDAVRMKIIGLRAGPVAVGAK